MRFAIAVERADTADVRPLLEESWAFAAALYPAESNHFLDVAGLLDPAVTFLVAREKGAALGCAALYRTPHGDAELKSMVVTAAARGRGLARALLGEVERWALSEGFETLKLETGVKNADALALYERAGFVRRGRFGDYPDDPLSVFMEKRLR